MLLDVAVHFELQTVLVLDQEHEAQVPAVAEPEDLIQPVGEEHLGVGRLVVHQHQGPVGVQRLLVVFKIKSVNKSEKFISCIN